MICEGTLMTRIFMVYTGFRMILWRTEIFNILTVSMHLTENSFSRKSTEEFS